MELEVGIRITRDVGDLTFASTETETVFILAARLPGFRKDEIEVAINEEENQIRIRGGGHIASLEAVITSRVAVTREVSVECFDESFPVPGGVNWDRIDAWFDEEEKILIISIPKLWMEEDEEIAEHPIEEERPACKESVQEETEEPTEEEMKNEESELNGLTKPYKEKENKKEQQEPAGRPHLPPKPGVSILLSSAEEQLKPGEADAEEKIAAFPENPESIEQVDREEEDEVARDGITPTEKMQIQTEVQMAAMEDDFTASEKICATPKEFKKPAERAEAETPKIEDDWESETPKKELHPSEKEAGEQKIPLIDKMLETKKAHETPEHRPVLKPEKKVHEEHKMPTMRPMEYKYKTLDETELETREPLKVKGTAQQIQQKQEEEEQNQKKPVVKGPDRVLETEQLIESKKEFEVKQIEEKEKIKEQQAPGGIQQLPPTAKESMRLSPSEEQLQPGEADDENKIAPLLEYPESKERFNREEEDEVAADGITPTEKTPIQAGVKMAATEDDFAATEKVCAAPNELKKPTEGTEAETSKIEDERESETTKKELHPSKKEPVEHKIPFIDKPHETPEQRPMQKPEKKVHEEHKLPTMRPMEHKYKTLDVTELETREPLKVKGTAQQIQQQREEEEQNQKKALVKRPDRVLETEQLIKSEKEYEGTQIEEHRERKREKPQVKTGDEVLQAELIESEKEEGELQPNEKDKEKLTGWAVYEKPIAAEWPEVRKSEIELQGTKEDEEPKLTDLDIEKRASIETQGESQDVHQKEYIIKDCHEKPTEKPSQLIKEILKHRKLEEKEEKDVHQHDEAGLPEELLHVKPKSEILPEPRERHQKDVKLQSEITEVEVVESKHQTKSQETDEEIQKQEQEHEKPETVQKYQKSEDVGMPEKEFLKQRLHGFKEDEDRQLNAPDIEAFREREMLKPKQFSLDIHKQKTEKPTLKAPKEMRDAAEPTKTEKEEKVEPELQKPKEEAQEQKMPIGLSHDKTMTTKFQVPKEPEQKQEQDPGNAPEQVLEAAQDIQSESDKELKRYAQEVQEDKEPIVEMPEAVELPQKEEPKPRVDKFHEDEDHQRMHPDKAASKTRMSLELEEIYNNHQQEEEVMEQKAKKPIEKVQQQLFEVAESKKSGGEKEAKKVAVQPKEQEAREHERSMIQLPQEEVSKLSEPKKHVQVNEKVGVKEPDQILEHARQIQSEDMMVELQQHEDKVQEHDEFIVAPTYEMPEAAGLIEKEQLKQVHHELKEEEEKQWKIPDTRIPKSRESQYFHLEQVKKKHKIKQILKAKEATELGEEEEKEDKAKEVDKNHKPKVKEQVQMLEAEQVRSEELEKGLKQYDQEEQKYEKPIKVPHGTTDQVPEDEKKFPPKQLEKEFQQHEEKLQQEQQKLTIVSTCEKPKAAEYARKEEPKPQISEFQKNKNHQLGPDIETFTTKKLLKLEEASELLQQEQEIIKQNAEKPRAHKRLVDAIEPTQSEEKREAEKEQDQLQDQDLQSRKMCRMTTYEEEKEQEFHISVEGHDDEIIAKSQEPEKLEEPPPKELTTLQKEYKPRLEQIKFKEHQKPTVETPCQAHDINFKALEELALPTPKATKAYEVPRRQERYPKKDSEKFEKPQAGTPLKAPKIKEFRSLEEKEQELQSQKREYETEKPTLIEPKKMLEATETKKTANEEKEVEPELNQPEEQDAQDKKMHKEELLNEKARAMKLQEPKEPGQKYEKNRVSELEQVMDALQRIQSKLDENFKHYAHEIQKDKEPMVEPVSEKPKAAELTEKEEPKQQVPEFHEDEDHEWIGPDRESSKTRIELEKIYKDFQPKEDVMQEKSKKPIDKVHEKVLEVAELEEGKKEEQQLEQQEIQEYKKPIIQPPGEEANAMKLPKPKRTVQVHEKLKGKVPDQILKDEQQIQTEDEKKILKKHKEEAQEHEKFILTPTYKKPEAVELMEKEELKPVFHALKEEEANQCRITDIGTPKIRESQYHHQKQAKQKQKTEKPSVKAPREIQKIKEPTQTEEKEKEVQQHVEQPLGQDASEHIKPAQRPPYEKQNNTQSAKPKEVDKKHKPKFQMLEAAQIKSKEFQKDEKPLVATTFEKPQVTPPDQVLEGEEHFQLELKKELQKQEKPKVVPRSEKPKLAEYESKEEPKQRISELQEDKNHQRMALYIETSPTEKSPKIEEESQLLQQEQQIMKQKLKKQTKKGHKQFGEAAEPTQPEEEKEPDQPKEQEAQRRKTLGRPSHKKEIKQEFQISAEKGLDHEIIAGSQQPEKQVETLPREATTLEKQSKSLLEHTETKEQQKPIVEAPAQTPNMIEFKAPEELAHTTLKAPETKEVPNKQERYQQKESKEFEMPVGRPSFKTPKKIELGPHLSKEKAERQREIQDEMPTNIEDIEKEIKQLADEEIFEHEFILKSPKKFPKVIELENEVHEPMLMKEREETVIPKQKLFQPEEKEAPTSQQFSISKESVTEAVLETQEPKRDKKSERDDIAVKPPKPLPRIRGIMEAEGSQLLLTVEKEATEPIITPPMVSRSMKPERSPPQPSPDEEAIESEFPSLIQKEQYPYTDLQKPEEQETASRPMREFPEAAAEQEEKINELPALHKAQEEIEQLAEEMPDKIFEVPQQMKICELELHTPKKQEQEENPPSPLDHHIKTGEGVSGDEADASGAVMDKSTKLTKVSRRRRFHCLCQGRRRAFPVPPSTIVSSSAFVFSIMVLVFHFIKRKKSN